MVMKYDDDAVCSSVDVDCIVLPFSMIVAKPISQSTNIAWLLGSVLLLRE